MSNFTGAKSGVLQWLILGLLLFKLYIKDVTNISPKFLLFVDEANAVKWRKHLKQKSKEFFFQLSRWFKVNNVIFNAI